MSSYSGILTWDLTTISKSLHLSETDTRTYFTDGRRVSFLIERRLAFEVLNGSIAKSEGASWDVKDQHGNKWEVRSISNSGIYFCPSYMVGSGRKFTEPGFIDKLNSIEGFIVSDITQFPEIPYWTIPGKMVLQWWKSGKLGKSTKVTRAKALQLIKEEGL